MLEKLKQIIEEIKNIRNETKIRLSDNVLFENATKIFLSDRIQDFKKENIKEIKDKKTLEKKSIEELITSKQAEFLKKLGYEGKIDTLTKNEAKQLIKEYIENQKGENY